MYRWAGMASQFAADKAPNGATNSSCGGSFPPVNSTEARPPPACAAAVDSHTDRNTTTWLARPSATAMHASIAGPIWPAVSIDPTCTSGSADPGRCAPLECRHPRSRGRAHRGRDSSRCRRCRRPRGPRPAIARSTASSVRSSPVRPSRRPTCDLPAPVSTALPSNGPPVILVRLVIRRRTAR